jgi:hypothetical protein
MATGRQRRFGDSRRLSRIREVDHDLRLKAREEITLIS